MTSVEAETLDTLIQKQHTRAQQHVGMPLVRIVNKALICISVSCDTRFFLPRLGSNVTTVQLARHVLSH